MSNIPGSARRKPLPRQFSDTLTRPVPILADDDPRHGTINGRVNFKCKCPPCRAAGSAYWAARRAANKAAAA